MVTEVREILRLGGYMLVGGILAVFVRALYRRFAATVSNRDGFSRVFPLLTLATILIIFVVKSSLALSLGLVGALSIVRFRAAIKEPEEIVYLFFCISIGLALGAEYLHLALGGTVLFTAFVLANHYWRGRGKQHDVALLLTISGRIDEGDGDPAKTVATHVGEVAGRYRVQRLDLDDGDLQFRAVVAPESEEAIPNMVSGLQARLPSCRISYVNLESLL
jgi:hypothetical protein